MLSNTTFTIPYATANISVLGSTFTRVVLSGINVFNAEFISMDNNGIWRHNHTIIGDGTLNANLPSITQGIATKWNSNDPEGEPNYTGLTQP